MEEMMGMKATSEKGTFSKFMESDESGSPVYVNINTLLIMS